MFKLPWTRPHSLERLCECEQLVVRYYLLGCEESTELVSAILSTAGCGCMASKYSKFCTFLPYILLVRITDWNTWKLEAKTATDSGLKFKTTGVHNTDNGKVLAVLESEFALKDYGTR